MTTKPPRCPLCGLYFTTHLYFLGRRCLEPNHWLAAGLLHADDYYPLGQLVLQAKLEQNYHPIPAKENRLEAHSVSHS